MKFAHIRNSDNIKNAEIAGFMLKTVENNPMKEYNYFIVKIYNY